MDEGKERREVLQNDLRVRQQQGVTFLDHARATANDEAGGRYARVQPQIIIGATPAPIYPALPSGPWSGSQPEPGPEPPLGFCVDDLEPATGSPLSPVVEAIPEPKQQKP